MSFQPVVPFGGLSGWAFLTRTQDAQQEAFNAGAAITRDTRYFEDNISKIASAEALVADRRLLSVALGAFGLDADINNKFFLRKVLEDGTLDSDALSNRLSDKRYHAFAKAFGFGDFDTPRTALSEFGNEITDAYKTRQFEIAVGEQNPALRQALELDRSLDQIIGTDTTADGHWYLVMGQPPVRAVFETALGLPKSFGSLGLDLQLKGFRERSDSVFDGSEVAGFAKPETREKLVRLFLIRSELAQNTGIASSPALALLQAAS